MNEEDFNDFLDEMAERDWQRYIQLHGHHEGEEEDDGLSDYIAEKVRDEFEQFEDNVLAYMRGQTIRLENEHELEHSVNFPCMN
jgi:hypothetical protein